MGVAGKVKQRDAFREIGFVGAPVPFDLALAARLLLAPLVRHFFEEGGIDQAIQLIDIHRMDAVIEALVFRLMAVDRFVMLAPFIGMAGVKGIAHPLQHLVIESKPPEQFGELCFEHFLANIFAAAVGGLALALIGIAGAMVIDVAFLLDLADHRATAGVAGDEP